PPYKLKPGNDDFMENRNIVYGKSINFNPTVTYKIQLIKYELPNELRIFFKKPNKEVLKRLNIQLNANNYIKFFEELLYAEDLKCALAEKCPSVLPGDYILVARCGIRKQTCTKGYVRVESEVRCPIHLKIDASMRRMHQTVRNSKVDFSRLFPQNHRKSSAYEFVSQDIKFYTTLNPYQSRAVVVTTCITAETVYFLGEKKLYTHIFIDKAGQAIEPEIVTRSQNYFSRSTRSYSGVENQESQSPSRFNAYEACYVLDIIVKLREENVKLEEIGTVQKFQGQEGRVIIISAVRTESVSFLGEPRRFCVAVTRTKTL
ncbi:13477_t:CDS:2, partial [Funneliformis mosseae]